MSERAKKAARALIAVAIPAALLVGCAAPAPPPPPAPQPVYAPAPPPPAPPMVRG